MAEKKKLTGEERRKKATLYRSDGGLMGHIIRTYKLTEFVYEHLHVKKMQPTKFRPFLKKMYPQIPDDEIPSARVIHKYVEKSSATKMGVLENQATAIALKDEAKVVSAIADFNLMGERRKMYERALKIVDGIIAKAATITEDSEVADVWKAMENASAYLDKLDKLLQRYGYVPMEQGELNISFFQRNTQTNIAASGGSIAEEAKQIVAPVSGVMTDDEKENILTVGQQIAAILTTGDRMKNMIRQKMQPVSKPNPQPNVTADADVVLPD